MPKFTNYSLVEGDYKNFRFRRVGPEDYDKVCDHIAQMYCRGEPTSKLLGFSDKYGEEVSSAVRQVLPQGMSFLAEDKETGEIAGARITYHHTKDISFKNLNITTREAKLFFKIYADVTNLADIPTRYGVDNWAEFFFASTNPKYNNNGLAGEFYTRSLSFLKAEGFKHARVVVTNPHTKAATKKRGFEEASRIDYENFMDFDGKPVFEKDVLTPDHFVLCVFKKIE